METYIISGWIAGIMVGITIILYLIFVGSPAGCSTGYKDAINIVNKERIKKILDSYKFWFLVGVLLSGFIAQAISFSLNMDFIGYSFAMGIYDQILPESFILKSIWLIISGLFLGMGARMAGGCMTGHSLVGISMLGKYSLLATFLFFISGLVTTNILFVGF